MQDRRFLFMCSACLSASFIAMPLFGQAQHVAPIRSTNAPAPQAQPAQHAAPAHAGRNGGGGGQGRVAVPDPFGGANFSRPDLPAQPGLTPQSAPPTGSVPQSAPPTGLVPPTAGYTGSYPGTFQGANSRGVGTARRDRHHERVLPLYTPIYYPGNFSYGFDYPYINAGLDPQNTFPSYGEGQPIPFSSDVAVQQQQQQILSEQVQRLSEQLEEMRAGTAGQSATSPSQVAVEPAAKEQPPITVILNTGAKVTTRSFAVMNGFLWDLSGPRPRKIAINSINVQASERATAAAGAEFPALGAAK